MDKSFLESIAAKISSDFGHQVASWGDEDGGVLRPKCVQLSNNKDHTDIMVIVNSDGSFFIKDYSCHKCDEKFYGKTDKVKVPAKFRELVEARAAKAKEDRLKLFNKELDKWEEVEGVSEVFEKKRLRMFNSSLATDGHETAHLVKYTDPQGNVVAAQKRTPNGKFCLKHSMPNGAICVLQEGTRHKVFGYKVKFITESFSTAAEIAEARPNDEVMCTVGQSNFIKGYESVKAQSRDTDVIVAVLDKQIATAPVAFMQQKVEEYFAKKPHIQPDKTNPALVNCTDFNDVAMKIGKYRCYSDIDFQCARFLPLIPEVVGADAKTLHVLSAKTGRIEEVGRGDITKNIKKAANEHFINLIEGLGQGGVPEYFRRALRWSDNSQVYGIGVFKDGERFVANTKLGRFIVDDKGISPTAQYKPGYNIYENVTEQHLMGMAVETSSLQEADWNKLVRIWERLYGEGKPTLLMLLGWCIQGCYSGISKFRPHLWVTGVTGGGKSALTHQFLGKLFLPFSRLIQNTTAAGISQILSPKGASQHSPLLFLDEMSSEEKTKAERQDQVLQLAREAATCDVDTVSLRGTVDQTGRSYQTITSMVFSSVEHDVKDGQDLARFLFHEVDYSKFSRRDAELFEERDALISELMPKIANMVISEVVNYEQAVILAHKELAKEITDDTGISHKLRTVAAIIAGVSLLHRYLTNSTLELSVRGAFKELKPKIDEIISHQVETAESIRGSLLSDLRSAYVKIDGSDYKLVDTLKKLEKDCPISKQVADKYGIGYNGSEFEILSGHNMKLHKLPGFGKPVAHYKSALKDLGISSQSYSYADSLKSSKRLRCYKVVL